MPRRLPNGFAASQGNLTDVDREELAATATDLVGDYLGNVTKMVDAQFGNGYAKDHAELVAALVAASSQTLHTLLTVATRKNVS